MGGSCAAQIVGETSACRQRIYDDGGMVVKQTMQTIEERLKEYRFSRDWTQAQLALAVGIGERTLRRAEAGEEIGEWAKYKIETFLKGVQP